MKIVNVILWVWQLPQNLAGFILSRFARKAELFGVRVYYMPLFSSAVSLGDYILFDSVFRKLGSCLYMLESVNHESGHSKQSKILGPLYLPFVGLPSLMVNIYARIADKDNRWYYKQPWEAWADKLGGVKR